MYIYKNFVGLFNITFVYVCTLCILGVFRFTHIRAFIYSICYMY